MQTRPFRSTTCTLLIAVVFVMGGAMSGAVAHELQHAAHHTAGSHSKGICAWMCATGAMAGQASIYLGVTLVTADSGPSCPEQAPLLHSATSLNSRAPPPFIV